MPPSWNRLAARLDETLPASRPATSRHAASIRFQKVTSLPTQGYSLTIDPSGITVKARSEQAAFYALTTLRQLIDSHPDGRCPLVTISDHPDIKTRGAYLDITRGRVPTLNSLKQTIRLLAYHKINHVQLYIEHVFQFAHHPDIGKRANPLSPADIRELDDWCNAHFIELTPSLASFGHMAPILSLPAYRHMAEDLGKGQYERPGTSHPPYRRGWTLSPAHPDSYRFIQSLYNDFLPHFSSKRLNVCCDETYDLGDGQSYSLCETKGRGRVYTDHVLKLKKAASVHKKDIMFWSDVIREHPDQLARIP